MCDSANSKYAFGDFEDEDDRPAGSMVGAKKDDAEKKDVNYQAKGTGYGHGGNTTQFDAQEYLAAQVSPTFSLGT